MIRIGFITEKNSLYLIFGSAYFVQGAALAYFQNFNKQYLESNDIDGQIIGIISGILLIPFLLKIFIGIVSDHYPILGMGKRKPYILIGLLLGGISFFLAGFFPPEKELLFFTLSIVFGAFSITLFDSSTDGLAIDSTENLEHGKVQGIMVASRSVAYTSLTAIFGRFSGESNYDFIFWTITTCMLAPILILLFYKAKPKETRTEKFQWAAFSALRKSGFLVFALYVILYSLVSFGVDGLVSFFINRDLDASDLNLENYATLRSIGVIAGAIAGWILIDRLGHKKSSFYALAFLSIGAILISLAWNIYAVFIFGVIWGIAWGFQETVFFCLAMDITDSRIAASMFAIITAISNLGSVLAEIIFGGMVEDFGYRTLFQLLACLNFVTFCILFLFFYMQKEKLKAK